VRLRPQYYGHSSGQGAGTPPDARITRRRTMFFNFGSTFNTAFVNQGNFQLAQNIAINSPGAVQVINQGASNNAFIFQR
jgi:hypothetical protein